VSRIGVIVAFFAALGVLAGVGAFTFGYAKGFRICRRTRAPA
jgi:hypothetical protein